MADSQRAADVIVSAVEVTVKDIRSSVQNRAYKASNELRNASLFVLRGKRSGRIYRVPSTQRTYQASAPGEAPAVRTGAFRNSWRTNVHVEKQGAVTRAIAAIESSERAGGRLLGEMLENGTGKMKPRPYKQKIIDRALPRIREIYNQSYKGRGK